MADGNVINEPNIAATQKKILEIRLNRFGDFEWLPGRTLASGIDSMVAESGSSSWLAKFTLSCSPGREAAMLLLP